MAIGKTDGGVASMGHGHIAAGLPVVGATYANVAHESGDVRTGRPATPGNCAGPARPSRPGGAGAGG